MRATRRQFLGAGLSAVSMSAGLPAFLARAGVAMAAVPKSDSVGDRIVVVVQLGGGNDGLNTVIPYGMEEYYRLRPRIGLKESQVLKIGRADGYGLHPAMRGVWELMERGRMAVVQGVGYPNPNRSHFVSMGIWHTANPAMVEAPCSTVDTGSSHGGWLGRTLDAAREVHGAVGNAGVGATSEAHSGANAGVSSGGGLDCVCMGGSPPLAAWGRGTRPVGFSSGDGFAWIPGEIEPGLAEAYGRLSRGGRVENNPSLVYAGEVADSARAVSARLREASRTAPETKFAWDPLSNQLKMVASLIRSGLPTRAYFVSMDGFDTHARQPDHHAWLLGMFSNAIGAFYRELERIGQDHRVLTVTMSEFGRRAAENGSAGTDHGSASAVMMFGPMVNSGLIGKHPSLSELDDGDLRPGIDFRGVYAAIGREWLGVPGQAVVSGEFPELGVIHTGVRCTRKE